METTTHDATTTLPSPLFIHTAVQYGLTGKPSYEVKIKDYIPDSPDHDWRKIMFNNDQGDLFVEKIINNRPSTIGELAYRYMETLQKLAISERLLTTLQTGLAKVNDLMNEYAENEDMCGDYERFLGKFNQAIADAGYRGNFEFIGRVQEKMFTVERHRTVVEQITVTLEVTRGQEDSAEETAVEIAGDCSVEDWTVTDEEYSDEFYNVIDVSDA